MTLADLARLIGVSPKWVLNTTAALDLPRRYTPRLARRLAIVRAIRDATAMPLPRALSAADRALGWYDGETAAVHVPLDEDGAVALSVDVHRIVAALNVRRAALAAGSGPRRRGRPPRRRRDPLRAAREWGLDLSLLRENLRRTPAQRLRQLDAMAAFARDVRRGGPTASAASPPPTASVR